MVGVRGFEPPASWSRTKHSTKLSHTPLHLLDKYTINERFCQELFLKNPAYFSIFSKQYIPKSGVRSEKKRKRLTFRKKSCILKSEKQEMMTVRLIEKQEKYQKRLHLPPPYETAWSEIHKHIDYHKKEHISLTTFFNIHRVDFHQSTATCAIVPTMLTSYHNHDFYELNAVTSGCAFETVEGTDIRLDAGDVLFLPLSMRHCVYLPAEANGLNILVSPLFPDAVLSGLADSVLMRAVKTDSFLVFRRVSDGFLLSEHLINVLEARSKGEGAYQESLIQTLLMTFENEVSGGLRTFELYAGDATEKADINTLFEYMQTHLDTVNVEELCERFHYSRSSLYRHIKKHTGYGYYNYISVLRYNHARYLLKNTSLTDKQIASRIGFSGVEPFCRFFRKQAMTTPQEFRRMCRDPKRKQVPDSLYIE